MPNGHHHHHEGFFKVRRIPKYIQIIALIWLGYNFFALSQTYTLINFELILTFIAMQMWLNIKHWLK